MNFLYFVANRNTLSARDIKALGLSYAFDAPPATRECLRGPGDQPGIVLTLRLAQDKAEIGYFPDRQAWQPMSELGCDIPDVWIGYEKADPPCPGDLARSEMVDGYQARLEMPLSPYGGEANWLIPTARLFPEGTALPQALSLGVGGKLVRKVLPRFAAACSLADRLWDQVRKAHDMLEPGETIEAMTVDQEFLAAAEILAVNYRVGVAEVSLLGVLTTANLTAVALLFVDWPTFRRHQEGLASKKNDSPSGQQA